MRSERALGTLSRVVRRLSFVGLAAGLQPARCGTDVRARTPTTWATLWMVARMMDLLLAAT